MKKILFTVLIAISFKAFSQEHWEDNFWREEGKKRYAKTLSMAGLYTEFYSNGQIKWQGKCLENGNPDSTWVFYNEEGKKLWEGEYNGKYYEYREYSNYDTDAGCYKTKWDTTIIGNYKNGLKDGEWQVFDYNGKFISKKGHYSKGEPTGIWQEFQEYPVITEVMKTAEYNYNTQNRVLYKKDSIDGTTHIDSLDYDDQYGIKKNNYNSESIGKVNICFIGSEQFVNFNQLTNYFFQAGHRSLKTPIQSGGMEFSGTSEQFYWTYNINWNPAISAQVNDSIKLRLSGYSTSLCFGYDFIKSDIVDLAPTIGIGFQQLKLKVLKTQNPDSTSYDFKEGDFKVYRNSAPTVNAILNFRLNLGVLSINLSGGYVIDCSSPKWRYNGKFLNNSPYTSVSGPVASISLGFHFPVD